MADERQQKPADERLSSIEIEEVSESRIDDDSKTHIRPDKAFQRGRHPDDWPSNLPDAQSNNFGSEQKCNIWRDAINEWKN